MHWMPATALKLFESEMKRINDEGQKLISDLLRGDVDAFMRERHKALVADLNVMYAQLGGQGQVPESVITKAEESLRGRLRRAQVANFMPKLSYSTISFARIDNDMVSPWARPTRSLRTSPISRARP